LIELGSGERSASCVHLDEKPTIVYGEAPAASVLAASRALDAGRRACDSRRE
jgi:hypothetical protein